MKNKPKSSLEHICDFFVQEIGIRNIKQFRLIDNGFFLKINAMSLIYRLDSCSIFRISNDGVYSDNITNTINNKLVMYLMEHEGSPFEDSPTLNRLLQGME